MDRSKARWRFQPVSDEYGVHVSLCEPEALSGEPSPASAIIGTDWSADRIAVTLAALEAMYATLPDPEENTEPLEGG